MTSHFFGWRARYQITSRAFHSGALRTATGTTLRLSGFRRSILRTECAGLVTFWDQSGFWDTKYCRSIATRLPLDSVALRFGTLRQDASWAWSAKLLRLMLTGN